MAGRSRRCRRKSSGCRRRWKRCATRSPPAAAPPADHRSAPGAAAFKQSRGFSGGPPRNAGTGTLLGIGCLSLAGWAASVSVALVDAPGWYAALKPPPLALPAGPLCFAVLPACHGAATLAAWRICRALPPDYAGFRLWGWQIALAAAGMAGFFGLHAILPALALILCFAAAAGLTARRFARTDRFSALLMLPATAGGLYLAYSTAGFWWLNR